MGALPSVHPPHTLKITLLCTEGTILAILIPGCFALGQPLGPESGAGLCQDCIWLQVTESALTLDETDQSLFPLEEQEVWGGHPERVGC